MIEYELLEPSAVESKSPKIPPVKGVIAMRTYDFIPYIFYPDFDSLKTSLFSGAE